MDNILADLSYCCGCEACAQVCPAKAISLRPDKYGFLYPEINQVLCVDCEMCKRVCPALHNEVEHISPLLYSAYSNDEHKRNSGSSGGVFGLLAEKVLSEGGYVYGAAFDSNLKLRHIEVSDINDLPPILKSKYIQSDIGNSFLSVRKRLKRGNRVLFCGTPCQCQALSNFIGNAEREKLILVDFICHGVPSQEMFDKSIISWENRHRTRVNSFSFRHKCVSDKTEAGLHHWKLDTYDGRSFAGRSVKFPYYYTYLQYMFFRPSCYKCAYAKVDRCTDLTLGDFWGLYKIESMDISEFNRGYSMLIVNNTKGRNLLDSLDIKIKPYPLETAIKNNYAYVNPTIQSDISKSFYKDFSVLSWHDLERKYMIFKTGLFHKGIRFIKRKFYKLFSKC